MGYDGIPHVASSFDWSCFSMRLRFFLHLSICSYESDLIFMLADAKF